MHLVPRRELGQVLERLDAPGSRGVLVLGEAGTGKSTLLKMISRDLAARGQTVLQVPLTSVREAGSLGERVLDAIASSPYRGAFDVGRTVQGSAGGPSLPEAVQIARSIPLEAPVLLLEDLDEAPYPGRMATAIAQLSSGLRDWKFIVTSRREGAEELRRSSRFDVVAVGDLEASDAASVLRSYAPELTRDVIARIVEFTSGNPLLLHVVGRELEDRAVSWTTETGSASSLTHALAWLVSEAVSASLVPEKLGALLEELALGRGGHGTVTNLAAKTELSDAEAWQLLGAPRARALVVLDEAAGTAALFHDRLRDVIISQLILTVPFGIADLTFGQEEAERDELLDDSYVRRPNVETVLRQKRSIVVGDRGSGKSAIFRRLAEKATVGDSGHITVCPITNTGDLLHKIVDAGSWLDTDTLRAAWLVVVAAVAATALPESAPKALRSDASALRAAVGFPAAPANPGKRVLGTAARVLGGTTLKFAAGPAQIEVQIPSGSAPRGGKSAVNVDEFLRKAGHLMSASGHRTVVMFDRIDETFKYDRPKQQAVVQALMQAEAQVSLLAGIGLLVFLRTDLFELYDIQEKTKLVSRTLTLDWEEEEWLQVLVLRVLANQQLQHLARRLLVAEAGADVRAALEVLFPPELEGQPVDRWLIDSLRNGNGDVSPRLAVLLLYFAQEHAARPHALVSTLPLFSDAEVGQAMTRVSDLSFSEVVNDFKVAPSFVQNCRAAKLETFSLKEVRELFDEAEGKVSEQVRLLERLGFLERIVVERGSGADTVRESMFRIPRVYTRCWGYA
jgi:hypothetical protein